MKALNMKLEMGFVIEAFITAVTLEKVRRVLVGMGSTNMAVVSGVRSEGFSTKRALKMFRFSPRSKRCIKADLLLEVSLLKSLDTKRAGKNLL